MYEESMYMYLFLKLSPLHTFHSDSPYFPPSHLFFPFPQSVTVVFWGLTVFLRSYSVGDASSSMQEFLDALPPYILHAYVSCALYMNILIATTPCVVNGPQP